MNQPEVLVCGASIQSHQTHTQTQQSVSQARLITRKGFIFGYIPAVGRCKGYYHQEVKQRWQT